MWWCYLVVSLGLASFLIVRGLRGRRIGDEPRCRRCEYNLTGLESERCPECGSLLSTHPVVYGVRRRRWGSLIAALLVLLLFKGFEQDVVWRMRQKMWQTNWMPYYPCQLLLREAKGGRHKAIAELERRVRSRLLSASQIDQVAEAAFTKDDQVPCNPVRKGWLYIALSLYQQGYVGTELWEGILSGALEQTMTVRPLVRQGDPLVVRIQHELDRSSVCPWNRFHLWLWHEPMEVRVGERTIYLADGEAWRERRLEPDAALFERFIHKRMQFPVDDLPVGRWPVEYLGRSVVAFHAAARYPSVPLWSADVRLTGEVEILPADAPDPMVRFVETTIAVRPVIRQGDPLVIRTDYRFDPSAVLDEYLFWDEPVEVRVGEHTVYTEEGDTRRERAPGWVGAEWGWEGWEVMRFPTDTLLPGVWGVTFSKRQILLAPGLPESSASPTWSEDIRLEAEVEILPADAPDPVAWIEDPDFERELEESWKLGLPNEFGYPRFAGALPIWCCQDGNASTGIDVEVAQPLRLPVAFEAVLQLRNGTILDRPATLVPEYRLGCDWDLFLLWRAGETGSVWAEITVPRFEQDEVFVMLRASQDVARQTVDLYEIWKGELRFGPFKVEHIGPEDEADPEEP